MPVRSHLRHRPRPAARWVAGLAVIAVLGLLTAPARAALTSLQHTTPSWRHDSSITTKTWFGWDNIDETNVPGTPAPGRVLDDDTPDIGTYTGSDARFYQADVSSPGYGHRSTSNNYYSGFGPTDFADDKITVPTDNAGNTGGYTTVVFQMTAQNAVDSFDRTDITLNGQAPTSVNYADGVNSENVAQWFAQWTLTGNQATYDLAFANDSTSNSLDAFEVDTVWSATQTSVSTPAIPEPGTAALAAAGIIVLATRRPRRRAASAEASHA